MSDTTFLDWPFFDDNHRSFAHDLKAWAEQEIAPLENDDHHTNEALDNSFKNNPWTRLEFMAIRLSKTYKSQNILDFHNDFIQNVNKNINELLQRIPKNTLDFYIKDTKTTIEKITKDLY